MKKRKQTKTRRRASSRPRVKKPPVLFEATQRVVERIGQQVEGMFLTYWTSENGAICSNDVQAMYEVLRAAKPERHVTLFVKSDGGDGQSALRIIHLLRQNSRKLTVLTPLACASAATMLALGADEIQMGPLAFLTPIDTSLEHALGPVDARNEVSFVGQDEVQRIISLWERHSRGNDVNPFQEIYKYVHPLVLGSVDRATSLSIRLCTEILRYHIEDEKEAQRIATSLNSDYPAHEYPITPREARRLGLKVLELDEPLNELLLELNRLYSEMGQRSVTDFDESNYHSNDIVNIVEGPGVQLFFQNDKDWHYRKEDRQWSSLNIESCWHQSLRKNGRVVRSKIYMG